MLLGRIARYCPSLIARTPKMPGPLCPKFPLYSLDKTVMLPSSVRVHASHLLAYGAMCGLHFMLLWCGVCLRLGLALFLLLRFCRHLIVSAPSLCACVVKVPCF